MSCKIPRIIEYGIFGEGSHNLTNQKRENGAFSLLIGQNMRPFPENTVLCSFQSPNQCPVFGRENTDLLENNLISQ